MTEVKGPAFISNEAAAFIMNNFSENDPEKMKELLSKKLDDLLAIGEISEKDKEAALQYIDKNNLAEALAGRNKVEGSFHYSTIYGEGDIEFSSEADALMKSIGLNIYDLKEASEIADIDYEVQEGELKKIRQILNDKIKANGSDIELSKDDTKLLMEGLGLSVKRANIFVRVLTSIIGDRQNKTEKAMHDMVNKERDAKYMPNTYELEQEKYKKQLNEFIDGNSD